MMINPSITFVCCVESGSLEFQTVRMIESLRRWGGKFANSPVLAVTPRFGSPLARQTLQMFERLNVEYLRYQPKNRYSWNNFMNKPLALIAAQERSTSDYICWLDSDLLFLGEPEDLTASEDTDFLACSHDSAGGTTGLEDPLDPYWRKACEAVGVDIDNLPWVTTEREGKRIRIYFNSGVFVYRRQTNFANHYYEACTQLLDAHLSSQVTGIFFVDQVVLGLAMVKQGISWQKLPQSHNYSFGIKSYEKWYSQEKLKEAKIFHYHNAMWSDFWPVFMKCLSDTHPDVADWLSSIGPLQNDAPIHWKCTNKVLKSLRSKKKLVYQKSCIVL